MAHLGSELPTERESARPGCGRPRGKELDTSRECLCYSLNSEHGGAGPPPPDQALPENNIEGAPREPGGPALHRGGYETGSSGPPHPKRLHYVSPVSSIVPGSYTYHALRRAVVARGGWQTAERWGQGSSQGFADQEPTTKRVVTAGLRWLDGSPPVFYDERNDEPRGSGGPLECREWGLGAE